MKNKFEIYDWSGTKMFGVESEYKVLNHFTSYDWTPEKAQEIIDGIKSTIANNAEYKWANEDLMLVSHPSVGVIFWDLMKTRGQGSGIKASQDLVLSHQEFIDFMEDFKKFIVENM